MEIKIGLEVKLRKYGKIKILKKDNNNCFYVKNQHGFEGWLHYGEIMDYFQQ